MVPWLFFVFFCVLVQLQIMSAQLQMRVFFVTGGFGEVNGFLGGNAFLGGGLGCGS